MKIELPELRDGEHNAGLMLDEHGRPEYWLILLPGEQEKIQWQDAMDWAKSIVGELPNHREQRMLWVNLKNVFEADWYWSSEVHESHSDYADGHHFRNGTQYYDSKNAKYRARAVRRVPVKECE